MDTVLINKIPDTETGAMIAGTALGTFLMFFLCVVGVIFVLEIVGLWKIFTKTNTAGWKALIPFYSEYTQFKLFWDTKFFWIYLGASILYGGLYSAVIFSQGDFSIGIPLLILSAIILMSISLVESWYMVKSFKKSGWFFVGYLLFPVIFLLILGFDKSVYNPDFQKLGSHPKSESI
ncbi:DUF5684 domain-containing protein [Ileibacterium valens]|uniref:DUF5684 domain-containing protein n=1 Tax=Ileibacterium valens TaxID=1862668 RepID=UPI003516C092